MSSGIIEHAVIFLRFWISGLPGFVLAIGANALLIEVFHWPKPVAYLLVIWLQMTMGFVMCRYLVFLDTAGSSVVRAYIRFALSMGLIRIADWSLYTTLVELVSVPYLSAQICTSLLFIGVKFLSAKAIFRK